MSFSTTLTLNPVSTVECLQQTHYGQGDNHSNNKHAAFYHYSPAEMEVEEQASLLQNDSLYSDSRYSTPATEDARLLERMSLSGNATSAATTAKLTTATLLTKSNSYHGSSNVKTKTTIIKQDSLNGRIATSLTDSDSDYGAANTPNMCCSSSTYNITMDDAAVDSDNEEGDPFLMCSNANAVGSNSRRSARTHGKSRASICTRAHAFINRNWYLSYLVPLSILLALMFVAYLTRNYAKRLLYWIETQNAWVIFALFMLLFILVSFPIVVGYFVLMITAGYLFGCLRGFLTVILGANVGIAVAHMTIRSFRHRIPMNKLIKNETGRAILRVISGPRAFKVVLFTRLTPIPFGIQNAIFGVSSINPRIYHSATFLGLLPAQIINVYLGSTLRSMHEVLNNHGTAVTGYISFGLEVICGVALMFWVVQKARKELSETLLSDISAEGKLIDIQV